MFKSLTKRQKQVLDFINDFGIDYGYAPTFREIGKKFGLSSPATIHAHIKNLEKKGYLKLSYNRPRSLELVSETVNLSQAYLLKLSGLITAGQPIEAVEEYEAIAVPFDLVNDPANSYVLKVKGSSMVEDGILDGDLVVVERNPSPKDGDIVVALLDNAYATLKRFYREAKRIRLEPANKNFKPIYSSDPLIQGIVKGVIRRFN